MRVLISGFDPFGEDIINPSSEAVKLLPDTIQDIELIKVEIPTIAYTCVKKMNTYIEEYKPDVVINVGQAGGRKAISLERVAINVNDFSICDNDGQQFVDQKIYEDGETAYFTTLPIKRMYTDLKEAGFDVEVSNTAGTFVCNHIMYAMLYHAHQHTSEYKSGFVHIPYLPEQSDSKPSMPLQTIVEALKIAIVSACKEECIKGAGSLW